MRRRTPLHVAVINRRLDAVRRLLSVRGVGGESGTTSRVLRRCRSVDRLSLVDIDAVDADGYTALYLALVGDGSEAYGEIVTLLLQCGADVNRSPSSVSCDRGSGVDPAAVSTLALACQRRDLPTAELLLQYGACDADLSIMASAAANDDTDIISVLLSRQHAYADSKFGINRAALLLVQSQCDDDADRPDSSLRSTISSMSSFPTIMIDWRAMKLKYLVEPWLVHAGLSYLKMACASSLPPWLLQNNGHVATYLITRIDVSENQLSGLPCMLFTLPSLRILIAAGNQVRGSGML